MTIVKPSKDNSKTKDMTPHPFIVTIGLKA